MASAISYIQSVGFSQKVTGITAANSSFSVPAGAYIKTLVIQETAGKAITGGLKIGTTVGGSDIYNGFAVGANSLQILDNSSLQKAIFSLSSAQILYFDAVSSWNSANISVTLAFEAF